MAEQNDSQNMPKTCVKGCGFFGNQSTEGMCSKCFREFGPKAPAPSSVEEKAIEVASPVVSSPAVTSAEVASSEIAATPSKKVQTKKDRCFCCNKKLRLAQQFNCKCDYVFCSEHRYADKHECAFDYAGHAKELLAKNNPTVINDRINRI